MCLYVSLSLSIYIYIYTYVYLFSLSRQQNDEQVPNRSSIATHSFRQFRQLPPSLHQQFTQLTQPASQATKERVLHPVIGGQSPIRPHTAEVGLKPMARASSQANCAVQANRKGHPCTMRKNRSTSPAGVFPSSEEPARVPRAVVF